MVSTQSLSRELLARGLKRTLRWSRGVDHTTFNPAAAISLDFGPMFLYAGRLAVEKNLDAFLSLDLPGTKLVAGDGPARRRLEARYPDARFLGVKTATELANSLRQLRRVRISEPHRHFRHGLAGGDGLRRARRRLSDAGALDVVGASGAGVLDEDLRAAALKALTIDRGIARAHALTFTWENSARQFLDNINVARGAPLLEEKSSPGEQNAAGLSKMGLPI